MGVTLTRRLRPSSTDRAFRTLVGEAEQDLGALVSALAQGDLSAAEWHDQVLEVLVHAHAEAGYRGRLRAGDEAAFDRDDVRFGQLVVQEEMQFLDGFRRDLETGRYTGEDGSLDAAAVGRRANLYAARLYGTANEALALVAGDEEVWVWKTAPGETCSGCVRLEENSPYRGMPPTLPKMCRTPCLSNCKCACYSESGLETFAP